jgi:hypothetical protein
MIQTSVQKEVFNQKLEFIELCKKDFLHRETDSLSESFLSSPLIKMQGSLLFVYNHLRAKGLLILILIIKYSQKLYTLK